MSPISRSSIFVFSLHLILFERCFNITMSGCSWKRTKSYILQVGTLIALLAEEGEDWQAVAASAASGGESAASTPSGETESVSSQPTGGSTPGTEVKMPSLSPTMTEGTIVKWCKKVCHFIDLINQSGKLCKSLLNSFSGWWGKNIFFNMKPKSTYYATRGHCWPALKTCGRSGSFSKMVRL